MGRTGRTTWRRDHAFLGFWRCVEPIEYSAHAALDRTAERLSVRQGTSNGTASLPIFPSARRRADPHGTVGAADLRR